MVHLRLLQGALPDRSSAGGVDSHGEVPRGVRRHAGDDLNETPGYMLERIMVVVEDDNLPVRVVFFRSNVVSSFIESCAGHGSDQLANG